MELKDLKKVENIISKVYENSIAKELEIEEGDILISINEEIVEDIIEYKYLISDEYLEVEIQKKNGDIYIYEIEKDYDEDLGIEFLNPIIDKAKSCKNKCVFCFIDQLPKGMRKTLYFKDDDSRLSFLQGNFITLTNMSENDIQKMIKYRISPINISVHTTNSDLRIKMLNNKNAGNIYDIMKRLSDAHIDMNCQIVLCKDLNDKEHLKNTIYDLFELYPYVNSVAVVPVGLSKYRENLYNLNMFDESSSKKVISYVKELQDEFYKKVGSKFVFLSDEFYVVAKEKLPSFDEYEGFAQLENGVGLIIKFEKEIKNYLNKNIVLKEHRKVTIATGVCAYSFMKQISEYIMNKVKNLQIDVYEIENEFFGKTITVTGLITGIDLVNNLKDKDLGDALLISKAMLKADEDIFLDDMSLDCLKKKLNVNVFSCKVEGKDFVRKVVGEEI